MSEDELFRYGLDVFNNEADKFKNWMYKENFSLGGITPQSLLSTSKGRKLVEECLNRIEYGNFG